MLPGLAVSSSVRAAKVGAMGVRVGASLTSETTIEAVSVLLEKAVVPPVTDASTLVPWVPPVAAVPGLVGEGGIDRLAVERIRDEAQAVGIAKEQCVGVGDGADGDPAAADVVLPGTVGGGEARDGDAFQGTGVHVSHRRAEERRHRIAAVGGLVLGDGGEASA